MYSVEDIKALGKLRTADSFDKLLEIFRENVPVDVKREVVSSIGRHNNNDRVYEFVSAEAFSNAHPMELVYQMFRTCLYKSRDDPRFQSLREKIINHYHNEVIGKMNDYYTYRHSRQKDSQTLQKITEPLLLVGDSEETLQQLPEKSVQLIFTSPPYYNAREYSDYTSYSEYLRKWAECFLSAAGYLRTEDSSS